MRSSASAETSTMGCAKRGATEITTVTTTGGTAGTATTTADTTGAI